MTIRMPGHGVVLDAERLSDGSERQIVSTVPADSAGIDAFGRVRVSQPVLLLDSKRVGSVPDVLMTNSVTGTGTATYTQNRASTYLRVAASGDKVIRQTKARAVYQPGKSLLLFQTFICAPLQANMRQEIGYFDDKNGVFLDVNGLNCGFTRRSFVSGVAVDTTVLQANWNIDPFDGTGPSGITLDKGKPQILFADFEWLGVGRVRIGFVVDGIPRYAHEFLNANRDLTAVYMTNPNLPIRWEIEATGAIAEPAQLEAICGTMASEGGYEITGLTSSADSGATANQIVSGGTEEVLAVRMQTGFTEFATFFIQALSIINTTSGPFRWRLVLNPTETSAGAWTSVTNSVLERNSTRVVTANTGTVIATGYVAATSNQVTLDTRPVLTAGTTLAGVTDIYSLQITNLSVQSEDFYGSLTWREVF
jgi:hypothetical protein